MKSNLDKKYYYRKERLHKAIISLVTVCIIGSAANLALAQNLDPNAKKVGILQSVMVPVNPQNSADPQNFYYDIKPGTVLEDELLMVNLSDKVNTIHVYATNAFPAEDGSLTYSLEADANKEIGQWVTLDSEKKDFTLDPYEQRKIKLKITVPEGTEKQIYKGGFAIQKTVAPGSNGVASAFRKIAKIEINVTDTPKEFVYAPPKSAPTLFLLVGILILIIGISYFFFTGRNKGGKKHRA